MVKKFIRRSGYGFDILCNIWKSLGNLGPELLYSSGQSAQYTAIKPPSRVATALIVDKAAELPRRTFDQKWHTSVPRQRRAPEL